MIKPTLHDVARAAGVSYATADRVLNARGGVAEKSVRRVRQAISDLGYVRDVHAANLSKRRTYRFRLYLPQDDHSFFRELRRASEAEVAPRAADRVELTLHPVPAFAPDALTAALDRLTADECDCVGIVGIDVPDVARAVARLRDLGIAVVTLVSDAAPEARSAYVGIDNAAAGATAGRLLRLAHGPRPGRILPILGAHDVKDHRDRLDGARAVLAEPDGAAALLPAVAILDRPALMQAALERALGDTRDITGIYSIGAGNRALIRILAEMGADRPFVVLHELTPASRAALEDGVIDAVIDQKPAQEVALALDVMKALADGTAPRGPGSDLHPTIYLKDNLPDPGRNGADQ